MAILAAPLLLSAGQNDQNADLAGVHANIDGILSALANVAMQEKVSRFAGAGGTSRQLDSFELEVSVAEGAERYTGVRGHHRTYHHVSEIGGLWSFGELVTMLRTTRDIIDSSAASRDAPGGEEAQAERVVRFQSPAAAHRWFVTVAGRVYWLDFEGSVQISKRTGAIERLTWTSGCGPPGTHIASILWDVNFRTATLADLAFTLPSDSIFQVVRAGRNQPAEWNLTQYAAVGRYGSTVSVRYGP